MSAAGTSSVSRTPALSSRPRPALQCLPCRVTDRHAAGRLQASRRSVLSVGAISTTAIVAGVMVTGGIAFAATLGSGGSGGSGGPGQGPQPGQGTDARALTRAGMERFRANQVEESVLDFDRVIEVAPQLRPYMWQRGLSLYYLGRFAEGAEQFRVDVAVNPNDTEESIWTFLCEAQMVGPDKARAQFLQVGRDSRPVMRAAYECFRTGQPPEQIMEQVKDSGGHDTFYGLLYVGLWHEAHGDTAEAQKAITASAQTPYARLSGDYMASLAKVHCQRRGWAV